ncbi:MAG: ABC transporter substrate-binding protein [Caldilineaceae bacterium]
MRLRRSRGATILAAKAHQAGGGGEQAAPSASGAKILARLNGIDPPGQEFVNNFIVEYGAENNVEIEIDYTDWASSFQKITTGLALGTAPDIFMGGGCGHRRLPRKTAHWRSMTTLPPGMIGKIGIRQHVTTSPTMVYLRSPLSHERPRQRIYRKSKFEEAGLDPAKPPATWEGQGDGPPS